MSPQSKPSLTTLTRRLHEGWVYRDLSNLRVFHADVMAKKDIEHPDGLYRQVKVVKRHGEDRTQDQIDLDKAHQLLSGIKADLRCYK